MNETMGKFWLMISYHTASKLITTDGHENAHVHVMKINMDLDDWI